MTTLFALVDCNNFYVSCERVFNPGLEHRPVVVLSNNDGCIVSRSNEVKALGIGMGKAAFEVRDILTRHHVEAFSSNYTLYADMSGRVMQTLADFTPAMEVYSIDEAFLDLSGIGQPPADYGRQIQHTVRQWTGIPVSVGIAPTKTLAKLANKIAKKSPKAAGVLNLADSPFLPQALQRVAVQDVWGVGLRIARKLNAAGIMNALDLSKANIGWIRGQFGVQGVRTVYELRAISCYPLEENPQDKKTIIVSRMFGRSVTAIDELMEAAATYAARAGEKLRQEGLAAGMMSVSVATSRFIEHRYYNVHTTVFPTATFDSAELVQAATASIERIYREGFDYKRAGVLLHELTPQEHVQRTLFDTADRGRTGRLMRTLDAINRRGDCTVRWAAEGIDKPWHTQFKHLSPKFTTRWDQLPVVS